MSIVLCHVIQKVDDVNSVHGVSEWKRHFHLDWVLPLLPDVEPKQPQCCDFSSPFTIQDPPLSLYEHFFVVPCDKDSRIIPLLLEWRYSALDHG